MKAYLALIAPAALIVATACHSTYEREHTMSSYDSSDVTNVQKADFIRTTDNYLRDVERKIDGWKMEAKDASGNLKEERYEHVTTLEKDLDIARAKLNKLKTASKEDYKDCKEDVDDALDALNKELDKSKMSFR